jgi:hypothetical protein|tara:strand:- start:5262 stop:5672 length:411 start_codon:yes stop_codon:yes gene_type:complete
MARVKPKKPLNKQLKSTKNASSNTTEVVEEVISFPKIYYIPIYYKHEPIAKNVHIADYIYKEAVNELSFFEIVGMYSSELEGFMDGDISVVDDKGTTTMVSRHEQTLEWVKSLHMSKEFSGNPYLAGIPLEDYEVK